MTNEQFRRLVNEMRIHQRGYFRHRDPAVLEACKRLEKEVDAELRNDGQAKLFDPKAPRE